MAGPLQAKLDTTDPGEEPDSRQLQLGWRRRGLPLGPPSKEGSSKVFAGRCHEAVRSLSGSTVLLHRLQRALGGPVGGEPSQPTTFSRAA